MNENNKLFCLQIKSIRNEKENEDKKVPFLSIYFFFLKKKWIELYIKMKNMCHPWKVSNSQ